MRKTIMLVAAAATSVAVLFAGQSDTATAAAQRPKAIAELKDATGRTVGRATMIAAAAGTLVRLEVNDLPPGWHGLHVHETGACTAPAFTSAGAHLRKPGAPTGHHGLMDMEPEAGDLPNLFVGADGKGGAEFVIPMEIHPTSVGRRDGLLDADGASIVIHANPDDHQTDPIGGAGARIACGVILHDM